MQEPYEETFEIFLTTHIKNKGLTLEKLSEISGIALKHIENLSTGRYDELPPAPYIHGYLVRLGEILEFDGEAWWKRLRKDEYIESAGRNDELPHNRYSLKPFRKRTIIYFIIAILIILYVGTRFSSIFGVPTLTVVTPAHDQEIIRSTTPVFTVRGTIKNGNEVLLNNESATLQNDGSWEKEILLNPGQNTIEIRAKKFLGRETAIQRTIYWEEYALPTPTPPSPSPTSTFDLFE